MKDISLSTSLALVATASHNGPDGACSSAKDVICSPPEMGFAFLEGQDSRLSTVGLEQLLPNLQQMDDDGLRHLALQATRLEQYAFCLRGAVASEVRRRLALRLSGGRGRRDHEGKGVRACLRQLATEIGVSVVTLTTDARIYDVFFTPNEGTVIARDNSLPREYYVIALAAPDPLAAIHIAQEQAAGNGCTREEFRRYVRELKCAAHTKAVSANTAEASAIVARTVAPSRQQVRLTGEARYVLNELMKASGCTADQIIADALIARYHALIEPTDVATTHKSHTSRRSRRTPVDDDASRQTQPSLLG